MSANLDLVQSIYADWERGEWGRGDWASPDIEYEYVGGPEPGSGTGLAGLASTMRDWLSAWSDWRVAAVEFREIDNERVFVTVNNNGRGKATGLEIQSSGANLFRIRNGNVVKLVSYWDRDDASIAIGVEE
jgi:ketosteroid isomerase-like protein